ncbi:MAG: hypothetical protein PVH88_07490 [Ignavibacteria bacterium]|jgi:hypothetical protein
MNNSENNKFDENAPLIWKEDDNTEKEKREKPDSFYKFFGLLLLIISAASFTNFTEIFGPGGNIILSIIFMLTGLVITYKSIGTNNNYVVFISSFLFLTGVFSFIFEEFYIINAGSFIFGISICITGCSLIILFINSNLRKYLTHGIAFILAAALIILFFRDSVFNFYLSNIIIRLLNFWEMILVVVGVNLVIRYR